MPLYLFRNAHLEIRYEETGDSAIKIEIDNGQKAVDELR